MSRNKKILLALAYVGFLAVLFEGSARLAFRISGISYRLYTDEDYSWRRDWVQRHQKAGTEIYYGFDRYDPTKGWISQPNVRDMKVFGNKFLNTNSRGLRGKVDFPYGKNKDRQRILVLGDSFSFGDEVSDDETYCHFLQEMLPNTEIINMAVHGYGHDQMLILLNEEGLKYEPDIVILGYLPIDMPRNLLNFRDFAKPRFVLENGELKLMGTPVPRPEEILRWDWARPRILDMFSIVRFRVSEISGLRQKQLENITTAILTNMMGQIESIHAIPMLAYLPHAEEISDPGAGKHDEAYMFSLCQMDQKAKCFSTRPHFAEKIAKGETFKVTGHWDAAGHRTVAEAIRNYLVDGGYVATRGNE